MGSSGNITTTEPKAKFEQWAAAVEVVVAEDAVFGLCTWALRSSAAVLGASISRPPRPYDGVS